MTTHQQNMAYEGHVVAMQVNMDEVFMIDVYGFKVEDEHLNPWDLFAERDPDFELHLTPTAGVSPQDHLRLIQRFVEAVLDIQAILYEPDTQ